MTNQELQTLDNQFSAINYLSCLGDFLVKFGETSDFSLCAKDSKTKIICMSNTVCNQLWGLEDGEMVGLTAREVLTRVKNFVNVNDVLEKTSLTEKQAVASDQQASFTQTALVKNGLVKIRKMIVIPLHGVKGLSIATVWMGLDITQNVNLLRLLEIYNVYYPRPKALERFSKYLNLKRYFMVLPTFEELKTVLAMVRKTRHKEVARLFDLSPKTVSNYVYAVKDKLKPNVDLHMLISSLRDHQQWGFEM